MRYVLGLLLVFMLIGGCGGSGSDDTFSPVMSEFPIDLGDGCLQIADNYLGTVVVCDVVEIRGLNEEERDIFNDLAVCLDEQYGLPACDPPEPIVYVANHIECGSSTSTACVAQFGESIALRPNTSISTITHELVHVHQWVCVGDISLNHCEEYWLNFCGEHFLQLGAPRLCPDTNHIH